MVVRLEMVVSTAGVEKLVSQAAVTVIQNITVLLVLVMVAFQGTVIIDLQRKLSVLRRQVLADRLPVNAALTEVPGKELPALDGISAHELRSASWSDYLPRTTGLVIVLDPIEESCWFIAEKLADAGPSLLEIPWVVLLTASPVDGERFLRKTGLEASRRVVLVGPRSSTLNVLGVRWRPAALAIRNGAVEAAAQVHDAKHLNRWATEAIEREVAQFRPAGFSEPGASTPISTGVRA